jgi:arylsulfatase B
MKPHILVLLSDDQGWSNVGFHNPRVLTPAIDALRSQGVELTRNYAYKFCSPSRSSLLSGRLPVHVNELNYPDIGPNAGVPVNMTTIASKLSAAGYACHQIGKWQCGAESRSHDLWVDLLPVALPRLFSRSPRRRWIETRLHSAGFASRSSNLPITRGFASSFGYFRGMEDHYTQRSTGRCDPARPPSKHADLWQDDAPAYHLNGTNYSTYLLTTRALRVLEEHDTSTPFFLLMAYANTHEPLQVPDVYRDAYPASVREGAAADWLSFQAMATALDDSIGQLVDKLRDRQMWASSLIVWTSDNGAAVYTGGGGNNFPLRGGKGSNFEGGVRVPTVVSGGFLPRSRWNVSYEGVTHLADFYATFATLAGVSTHDARAEAAGLPPVDGRDLTSALLHGAASPRAGEAFLLSSYAADPTLSPGGSSAVLIRDGLKLVVGSSVCSGWTSDLSPNKSHPDGICDRAHPSPSLFDCGALGCLFNVDADMGEHEDLASSQPALLRELTALLQQLNQTVFNPPRAQPSDLPCAAAVAAGGYWSPYLP